MSVDTATRLLALRQKIQEADRQRAAAEATRAQVQQRLDAIDAEITALGVKPEDAETVLQRWEAELAEELATIEQALAVEVAAYQAILGR